MRQITGMLTDASSVRHSRVRTALVTTQLLPRLSRHFSLYLQPLFDIVEWFLISDIINNNDTMCSSVVGWSDRSEPLLSSCVPNLKKRMKHKKNCLAKIKTFPLYLKFNSFPIKLNCSNFEVHPYCRNVRFGICVISKSRKEQSLSCMIIHVKH